MKIYEPLCVTLTVGRKFENIFRKILKQWTFEKYIVYGKDYKSGELVEVSNKLTMKIPLVYLNHRIPRVIAEEHKGLVMFLDKSLLLGAAIFRYLQLDMVTLRPMDNHLNKFRVKKIN